MRIIPLLFEDKEILMRTMWREQALFGNQINAVKMMESISILLFKPGFTIQDVPEGIEMQYHSNYINFKQNSNSIYRYRWITSLEIRNKCAWGSQPLQQCLQRQQNWLNSTYDPDSFTATVLRTRWILIGVESIFYVFH